MERDKIEERLEQFENHLVGKLETRMESKDYLDTKLDKLRGEFITFVRRAVS